MCSHSTLETSGSLVNVLDLDLLCIYKLRKIGMHFKNTRHFINHSKVVRYRFYEQIKNDFGEDGKQKEEKQASQQLPALLPALQQ